MKPAHVSLPRKVYRARDQGAVRCQRVKRLSRENEKVYSVIPVVVVKAKKREWKKR